MRASGGTPVAELSVRYGAGWQTPTLCNFGFITEMLNTIHIGQVMELADMYGSGPYAVRREGSNPSLPTGKRY